MNKILIIIGREFSTRVRKKTFLLVTIFVPILIAGLYAFMLWMMLRDDTQERKIAVVNRSELIHPLKRINNNTFEYGHEDMAEADLSRFLVNSDYYAAIYVPQNIIREPKITIYSRSQIPMELENNITRQLKNEIEKIKRDSIIKQTGIPDLEQQLEATQTTVSATTLKIDEKGEARESSSVITSVIGIAAGIVIYIFIFMYATQVMQGVLEEKINRIIEVLVSSVKPIQFLFGKIIGIAGVGLLQFVIWIILGGVIIVAGQSLFLPDIDLESLRNATDLNAMTQTSGLTAENLATIRSITQTLTPQFVCSFLISFILYFIGGYLLYAAMFAAIGAAVDSQEETQQFLGPLSVVLVIGLYIGFAAIKSPESPLVFWTSMIPFTSPIVMLVRIPFGVATWEILLSLGILGGTFILITWISAKIYRVGILMYGKKASWKEIYKWLKY